MAGLFGVLLGASGSSGSTPPPDADVWYNNTSYGGYGGAQSKSGRFVTAESSMTVSTVYACVNLLAKTVGAMPLGMYRYDLDGNKYAAPEHPVNDVLEFAPNAWQTAFDFKCMMMMHLALRGNAYAEIISGPRGAVHRLEPIHPDTVEIERLIDGTLRYNITDANGRQRRLVDGEVFHIRSAICPGGLKGISPVAYAKETIGLTLAAEEHGSRMFSNGARPGGQIKLPGHFKDQDAFDAFKHKLNDNYSSVENAHRLMVLEDGAEFIPITLKADELQFLQTRKLQVEEVARWFDVPLVLLHSNDITSSWGTGVEAVMLAFVRNNLMPWLSAWEQAIRRDLIIAPRRYRAEFDVSALQRGDSKALAEFYSKLVLAGILSRNEARAALQYNAHPDLDRLLMPSNTTTTDQPMVPDASPTDTQPAETEPA